MNQQKKLKGLRRFLTHGLLTAMILFSFVVNAAGGQNMSPLQHEIMMLQRTLDIAKEEGKDVEELQHKVDQLTQIFFREDRKNDAISKAGAVVTVANAEAASGEIIGTVTALDKDGKSIPLNGIIVGVFPIVNGVVVPDKATTTDAEGKYTIGGLDDKKEYYLYYWGEGYIGQWHNDAPAIACAEPVSPPAQVDVVLSPGVDKGTISGTVTDSNDTIAGIWVVARDDNGGWARSAITDVDGKYTISQLPTSATGKEYTVHFAYAGSEYITQWYNGKEDAASATKIKLTDTLFEKTGINAQLEKAIGTIAGIVTDSSTNLPIQGIEVRAYVSDATWPYPRVITDVEGKYTIPNLPTSATGKKYTVQFAYAVSGFEYIPQWYNGKENSASADKITLTDAVFSKTGINAQLQDALGTISGIVKDSKGTPIEGIMVYAFNNDDIIFGRLWKATTGANGKYEIPKLPTSATGKTYDLLFNYSGQTHDFCI